MSRITRPISIVCRSYSHRKSWHGERDRLHEQRNEMMLAAEELGVSTRQGTHAIHGLGYQRTYGYT